MTKPAATLFLMFSMVGATSWGQTPVPLGAEFQVNTYTADNQYHSSVGVDAVGNFVVVWVSYGASGKGDPSYIIQGQRYDAAGAAVGGEFQVNTNTTFKQFYPSVGVDAEGSFVVVWQSYYSSGTDTSSTSSIQGQRYDATGTSVSDQFQVNTYTTNNQISSSVAAGADGSFVVVWSSTGSSDTDTDLSSIQGQRYDATGTALGDQFQVNTHTTSNQTRSSVGVDADGNFVVVWQSNGSSDTDTDRFSVQGQRYDATGAATGDQFQVNTYTTNQQQRSSVGVDGDGSFVVVWGSTGSSDTDTSSNSIQGQLYDATGTEVGGEFQINTYTTSSQWFPSVGVDGGGRFVVVWQSYGSSDTDTSSNSIHGQRYDGAGTAIGNQFQVNTYTTGTQYGPSVAVNADSNFVVVWDSNGSSGTDTDQASVQGQRFASPIFIDGFESGDTSAWSSTL